MAANRAFLAGLHMEPSAVQGGQVGPLAPGDPLLVQAARQLARKAALATATRQVRTANAEAVTLHGAVHGRVSFRICHLLASSPALGTIGQDIAHYHKLTLATVHIGDVRLGMHSNCWIRPGASV